MRANDLSGVDGFLFDMDGVWFVGDRAIPGAARTLARIRELCKPLRIVTNTTTQTREQLSQKLRDLGFDIRPDEIINSVQAAVLYLKSQEAHSCHLLVADDIRPLFAPFPSSLTPDYVVIGDIGEHWSYTVLNQAFRMVMEGARILALHKGRFWQVEDGLRLDIGAFVAGLEYATGTDAVVAGKPSRTMFDAALADMGVDAGAAIMVGDDVRSDVGGAMAAGIRGVLVKTGKYREPLVKASGVVPDLLIDSVADLARLI
jgi:HAD superfamily hydrolase (TIGR01458 family)